MPRKTKLEGVLFDKKQHTQETAKDFLKKYDLPFKREKSTSKFLFYRISPQNEHFRLKTVKKGIQFIIGW
jgi:hypothetical protein